MKRFIIGLLLLLALSFGSIRPLLSPGFFPMHDDTQVGRVVVMGKALREGQFPVRWVTDLGYGYGYPIFNFYGPLPYYVGGFFAMLGVSGLVATKLMFGIGIIGAGIAFYAGLFPLVGLVPAFVGALFYLYAPYHAVQIYVRGAVGEFWALMFLPFILLGIFNSEKKQNRWRLLVGVIGIAGVILSHTIMGYIVTGMLIVSVLFYRCLWSMILLGLSLSAFFWLPATFEMVYTSVAGQIGKTANFRDHFVCLSQLWSSPWGFAGSSADCIHDGMSFMIGKLHIFMALVGMGIALVSYMRTKKMIWIGAFGIIVTAVSILFMLPISRPLWEIIPKAAFIQYPWRFLALTIFGASVLAAAAVWTLSGITRMVGAIILVLGVLVMNVKWFAVKEMYVRNPVAHETREELRFRVSKVSDEYLASDVPHPIRSESVPQNPMQTEMQSSIEQEIETDVYKKYFITSPKDQTITLNTMMFPGWRYWVNGTEVFPVRQNGLPAIMVSKERSAVELRFINTPVRTVGNLISGATVLALLFIYGKQTRKAHA